jgi:hypothetical protein
MPFSMGRDWKERDGRDRKGGSGEGIGDERVAERERERKRAGCRAGRGSVEQPLKDSTAKCKMKNGQQGSL